MIETFSFGADTLFNCVGKYQSVCDAESALINYLGA